MSFAIWEACFSYWLLIDRGFMVTTVDEDRMREKERKQDEKGENKVVKKAIIISIFLATLIAFAHIYLLNFLKLLCPTAH